MGSKERLSGNNPIQTENKKLKTEIDEYQYHCTSSSDSEIDNIVDTLTDLANEMSQNMKKPLQNYIKTEQIENNPIKSNMKQNPLDEKSSDSPHWKPPETQLRLSQHPLNQTITTFKKKRQRGKKRRLNKELTQMGNSNNSPSANVNETHLNNLLKKSQYFINIWEFPINWSEVQIKDFLQEACGPVNNVEMLTDSDKNFIGHIKIEFDNYEQCKFVQQKIHGRVLEGVKLVAEMNGNDDKCDDNDSNEAGGNDLDTSEPQNKRKKKQKKMWRPDIDVWEPDPSGLYGLHPHFLTSIGITPPIDKWVYVTNFRCDKSELKEVMELAGHVVICTVMYTSQRYANVMYSHPLEAVQAVSMLHNQNFYGNVLKVTLNQLKHTVLPKGLSRVGPGLGTNGQPLREVVREYERYAKGKNSKVDKTKFFDPKDETSSFDVNETSYKTESVMEATNQSDLEQLKSNSETGTSQNKSGFSLESEPLEPIPDILRSEGRNQKSLASESKDNPVKIKSGPIGNRVISPMSCPMPSNQVNSMSYLKGQMGPSGPKWPSGSNLTSGPLRPVGPLSGPCFPNVIPTGTYRPGPTCPRPQGPGSYGPGPQGVGNGPGIPGPYGSGPQVQAPYGPGPQGPGPYGPGPLSSGPQGSVSYSPVPCGPEIQGPRLQVPNPYGPGSQGPGPCGPGSYGSGPQGLGPNGPRSQDPGPSGPGSYGSGPQGLGPNGPRSQGPGPCGPGQYGPRLQVPGPLGPGPQGLGQIKSGLTDGPRGPINQMPGTMPGPLPGPMPGPMPGPVPGPVPGPIGGIGPTRSGPIGQPASMSSSLMHANTEVGSTSVEISNLPLATTFPCLCDKMAACGQVMAVRLTTPGCAIVQFAQRVEAERCLKQYNDCEVQGNILKVKFC